MTTSVRICLSYDPLETDFITFKTNIISIRKLTADTDAINDVTCRHHSIITLVVTTILLKFVIAFQMESCSTTYHRGVIKRPGPEVFSFYSGLITHL